MSLFFRVRHPLTPSVLRRLAALGPLLAFAIVNSVPAAAAATAPSTSPTAAPSPVDSAAASSLPAVAPGCTWREGAVVRGPTDAKRVALVFTGHSFAEGAPDILAALNRHHARASFFLTGVFLDNPAFAPLLQRLVHEGHYVGPHSDQHLLLCDWTPAKTRLVTREVFAADLTANRAKLARLSPAPTLWYLPPFEHYDAEIARWTEALGLRLINHTGGTRSAADYLADTAPNFISSAAIIRSILAREESDPHGLNGYLLLLHLGAGPERTDKMSAQLGALLDTLAARGYSFVRVDELLSPAQP
ncbi:polysaccharide deacetylase family protein [Opitutus sp. ER46]|uniref:polysaccharide deacetylase family protein n=1 Tax=Opitutus sp. ER46 TaxID=2161864 RepID=UPI000D3113C2|nr:polysaccharide deacetylase family protein [Opitutus sp. ER46]PTX96593.1 polysaccharide deacetylase [Opitutus sp. ER46]